MRAEFIFDFAYELKIPPREVDALRFLDFIQLVLALKALREARKKAAEPKKE